ncbi:MAG: 2OG-Fe(II) oxygenase family protein [Arenicella sp.]
MNLQKSQLPEINFQHQLQQHRFATIDFPLSRTQLELAANHFLDFLRLPLDLKRQLHFSARSHRASADGYTNKLDISNKDPKEFFHWTPMLQQQENYRHWQANDPVVERFFASAHNIYQAINQVLYPLFLEQFPEYVDELFVDGDLRDGILRFLSYAPQSHESLCAKAHFDKGFGTMAIAESASGLRVGCCDQHSLKTVEHLDGKALFMPGWMLFEHSQGRYRPAWHDVIHNPDESAVTEFCARWAIVFFINHPDRRFTSWQAVHSPQF